MDDLIFPYPQVMEMLSHINKRVRSTPQLSLPLSDLLALYHSPAPSSPLMLSFALVYVEMAFHRVAVEQQSATVPSLLRGLASRPEAHRDILLRCAVEVRGGGGKGRKGDKGGRK